MFHLPEKLNACSAYFIFYKKKLEDNLAKYHALYQQVSKSTVYKNNFLKRLNLSEDKG